MAAGAEGLSQRIVIRRTLVRFPESSCQSVLGQDTEPRTAPDLLVGTLHGSHRHQCVKCDNNTNFNDNLGRLTSLELKKKNGFLISDITTSLFSGQLSDLQA